MVYTEPSYNLSHVNHRNPLAGTKLAGGGGSMRAVGRGSMEEPVRSVFQRVDAMSQLDTRIRQNKSVRQRGEEETRLDGERKEEERKKRRRVEEAENKWIDPSNIGPSSPYSPSPSPTPSAHEEEKHLCPVCDEDIAPEQAQRFVDASVREQSTLCQSHRDATLLSSGSLLYPSVDFSILSSRLESHHATLTGIIDGTSPSHFRRAFLRDHALGSGTRSTVMALMASAFESHQPGYYGPRGAHEMMALLLGMHVDRLRAAARRSREMGRVGVAGFVQAVLVPEAGVLLIMQDMGVSETRAREVMLQSRRYGELVHPEP